MDINPGEKAAAEWEARHDTRARGARANPAAVQEYLLRARAQEHEKPQYHVAPPRARQAGSRQAGSELPACADPVRRSWFHRMFGRRRRL